MGVTSRLFLGRSELAREGNGRQQTSAVREQARSYRRSEGTGGKIDGRYMALGWLHPFIINRLVPK